MHLKKLLLLGALSGAALTPTRGALNLSVGIGIPLPVVVIRERPPEPVVEVRPVAPGPDFVWISGRWTWRHKRRWVWTSGHWDRIPRPGALWVEGHWRRDHDGWVWVEGVWNYPAPPPLPAPAPAAEVVVQQAPPAEYVETIPVAPGPNFIWLRGHWQWEGRWIWIHGRYEHRRPHAAWVEGHWDHRGGGWIWIGGRWR